MRVRAPACRLPGGGLAAGGPEPASVRYRLATPDCAIELLSVGDRVEGGTYRVHSRFRRAVNFTDGRRIVSVVTGGRDAGPLNIVVNRLDAPRVRTLHVEGRSVSLDGVPLSATDAVIYRSSLKFDRRDLPALTRNLRFFEVALRERAPERSLAFLLAPSRIVHLRSGFERELARHVEHCARDIFFGDVVRGVARVRGCGFGLTPAGDDLVAGLLLALRVLELATGRDLGTVRSAVADAARSGNALSETFLVMAAEGRASESVKSVVAALSGGSAGDVETCVDRVLAVGATSGADMAVGFCMALRRGLSGWPREPFPGRARGPGRVGFVAEDGRRPAGEGVAW